MRAELSAGCWVFVSTISTFPTELAVAGHRVPHPDFLSRLSRLRYSRSYRSRDGQHPYPKLRVKSAAALQGQ